MASWIPSLPPIKPGCLSAINVYDFLRNFDEKDASGGLWRPLCHMNRQCERSEATVVSECARWTPTGGTSQGAVVSPLLANLYLHPLDVLMAEHGLSMARYADDSWRPPGLLRCVRNDG
jgi:hypothetical protein